MDRRAEAAQRDDLGRADSMVEPTRRRAHAVAQAAGTVQAIARRACPRRHLPVAAGLARRSAKPTAAERLAASLSRILNGDVHDGDVHVERLNGLIPFASPCHPACGMT